MSRLHLRYREDDFDERLIWLTKRLIQTNPWHRKADKQRLFDTWVHGANIVYNLPEMIVVQNPMPTEVGKYHAAVYADKIALAILHKWSLLSLWHQYRHHMQANSAPGAYKTEKEAATDCQEWACSLFYVVAPHRFRRMVRMGRVAGVHPEDLLKRHKKTT